MGLVKINLLAASLDNNALYLSLFNIIILWKSNLNPNFAKLAEAYGMWGKEISSADQLVPALEEAFSLDGPALIAVPVDYDENRKLTARLGEIEIPS